MAGDSEADESRYGPLDTYDRTTAEITKSLLDYIDENYGERCRDFDENCATCKLWKLFDQFEAITK